MVEVHKAVKTSHCLDNSLEVSKVEGVLLAFELGRHDEHVLLTDLELVEKQSVSLTEFGYEQPWLEGGQEGVFLLWQQGAMGGLLVQLRQKEAGERDPLAVDDLSLLTVKVDYACRVFIQSVDPFR